MIRWFAGSLGQMTHWPSVWCSQYYFFAKTLSIYLFFFIYILNHKNETIEFWVRQWTSHMSHQPSEPVYHIEDCRILHTTNALQFLQSHFTTSSFFYSFLFLLQFCWLLRKYKLSRKFSLIFSPYNFWVSRFLKGRKSIFCFRNCSDLRRYIATVRKRHVLCIRTVKGQTNFLIRMLF